MSEEVDLENQVCPKCNAALSESLRVKWTDEDGEQQADVKRLEVWSDGGLAVWPNPAADDPTVPVRIDDAIWVVHAFKKKSKTGIRTPKTEVDLIRARNRRLKEMLE